MRSYASALLALALLGGAGCSDATISTPPQVFCQAGIPCQCFGPTSYGMGTIVCGGIANGGETCVCPDAGPSMDSAISTDGPTGFDAATDAITPPDASAAMDARMDALDPD